MDILLENISGALTRHLAAYLTIPGILKLRERSLVSFNEIVDYAAPRRYPFFYLGHYDFVTVGDRFLRTDAEICKPRIIIGTDVRRFADLPLPSQKKVAYWLDYDRDRPQDKDIRWVYKDGHGYDMPVYEGQDFSAGAIVCNPATKEILLNTTRPETFTALTQHLNLPFASVK